MQKDGDTGRYHNVAEPHIVTHPHRNHHGHHHHHHQHGENIIEYNSASKEFKIDHEAALNKLMTSIREVDQINPFIEDGEVKSLAPQEVLRKDSVFLFWSLPKEFLGNHV